MNSKLKVQLNEQQYDLMRRWSAFKGFETLSDWAKTTLIAGVPADAEVRMKQTALAEKSKAAAYEVLDARSDAADVVPQAPAGSVIMPAPVTVEAIPVATVPPPPNAVAGHPCVYLKAGAPPPWKARDCSGTCTHPTKKGTACMWASVSAKSCPTFRHKGPPPGQRPGGAARPGAPLSPGMRSAPHSSRR